MLGRRGWLRSQLTLNRHPTIRQALAAPHACTGGMCSCSGTNEGFGGRCSRGLVVAGGSWNGWRPKMQRAAGDVRGAAAPQGSRAELRSPIWVSTLSRQAAHGISTPETGSQGSIEGRPPRETPSEPRGPTVSLERPGLWLLEQAVRDGSLALPAVQGGLGLVGGRCHARESVRATAETVVSGWRQKMARQMVPSGEPR